MIKVNIFSNKVIKQAGKLCAYFSCLSIMCLFSVASYGNEICTADYDLNGHLELRYLNGEICVYSYSGASSVSLVSRLSQGQCDKIIDLNYNIQTGDLSNINWRKADWTVENEVYNFTTLLCYSGDDCGSSAGLTLTKDGKATVLSDASKDWKCMTR